MKAVSGIEAETARLHGTKHSPELQSIRGLAALAVLLLHCTYYYDYNEALKGTLEIFFNAHAAVVVFFVLSGHVLTLSLAKTSITPTSVLGFYVRRVIRIYPALFVALILALAYVIAFRGMTPPSVVSSWWGPNRRLVPDLPAILVSFTALRTPLPLPVWTLTIELCASFLLPFIVLLTKRRNWVAWALAVAYIPITLTAGTRLLLLPLYFGSFLFGAVTARDGAWWHRRPVGIALTGFALLWFSRIPLHAGIEVSYHNPVAIVLESIGAMLLIGAVAHNRQSFPFLRLAGPVWLGDISYSLYLLHLPLLGFIAGVGTEILGFAPMQTGIIAMLLLTALTVPVTMLASALVYRRVELPFNLAGKRLARKVERERPREAVLGD